MIVQGALRAGLGVAFALLASGMIVAAFAGEAAARPVALRALFGPLDLGSRLMGLGILVLGLTPVLRVLLLVLLWVREHDYRHAMIAAFVLLTLIVSIAFGVPA